MGFPRWIHITDESGGFDIFQIKVGEKQPRMA
jgi:hypothetical protein